MSLQLIIPWRVALQQSAPPLHQLILILQQGKNFAKPQIHQTKGVKIATVSLTGVTPAVCGLFKSCLQHSSSLWRRIPPDGSLWIVQVLPTSDARTLLRIPPD